MAVVINMSDKPYVSAVMALKRSYNVFIDPLLHTEGFTPDRTCGQKLDTCKLLNILLSPIK